MRKFFAYGLIIIGLIVILIPSLTNYNLRSTSTKALNEMNTMKSNDLKENLENETNFDYSIIEDIGPGNTLIKKEKVENDLIIGQLSVPSINLDIPIFKGINNTNLLAGVATMKENQNMGTGNYPIAGHYSKNKDILFGSLMDIKVDDLIKITDKNMIYEYVVYEANVVPDTAVYYIDDEISEKIGKPVVSLMTCYYSSKTGKRFFAMGKLNNSYPYERDLMETE